MNFTVSNGSVAHSYQDIGTEMMYLINFSRFLGILRFFWPVQSGKTIFSKMGNILFFGNKIGNLVQSDKFFHEISAYDNL